MHSKLKLLPDVLLNHLGAYSNLDVLERLTVSYVKAETLRQGNNRDSYHVDIPGQGLSLMLQCMDPEIPPSDRKWGLQSITLQANTWKGSWPEGLDANTATATDVIALLAGKPEEVMNLPPMVCFEIAGMAGQAWSVMAVFDSASGKLDAFSLLRVGPWRELQVTQPG